MKPLYFLLIFSFVIISCKPKGSKTEDSSVLTNEYFESDIDNTVLDSGEMTEIGFVYASVEELPQFRNGWEDIKNYLCNNIEYPQSALDSNIRGRVYLRFIINEHGSVSHPEIIRGLQNDIDNECLRVIQNMPDWKAGKINGKPVKTFYILPIKLELDTLENNEKTVITHEKQDFEFKLYPNPAENYINIELLELRDISYQIVNTNGQVLRQGKLYSTTETVDISGLSKGMYIVRLISKESGIVKTEKFIKI